MPAKMKMKHHLASRTGLFFGAGACLFLALHPASAQGAPAQDPATHSPAPQQEAAPGGALVPHRAVYELTLGGTGAGFNVSDIRGNLFYDFRGSACEGYTLNTRLITEVSDRDGKATTHDVQTESREDAEGKHFRFSTAESTNGKPEDITKGSAKRAARHPEILYVYLEKPKKASFALSGNILFPTQHSLRLLKAALAGQTRLQADIYDGSEKGAKVYESTSVIGPPLELSANAQLRAIENTQLLDGIPSWPVIVSYYDRDTKKDRLPSYEISFRMYANGVSRKLKLDYGAFSLDGELSSIEFLKSKPCP